MSSAVPPARRSRLPWLLLTGVLAALLVAWAGAAAAVSGKIPRQTTVLGTDIGGLTRDQAQARLASGLAGLASRPVRTVAAGTAHDVVPQASGLSVDVPATVRAAESGTWTPWGVLRALTGSREVDPVTKVDQAALDAAVARIAQPVDRPVTEGGITYTGTRPVVSAPVTGRTVDRGGAAAALRERWWTSAPVTIPVRTVDPAVSAAALQQAAAGAASTAVGAPVTVAAGGARAPLAPAVLAPATRWTVAGGRLVPQVDGARLAAALPPRFGGAQVRLPRDATFRIAGGRPVVVPSQTGRGVDPAALGTAVASVLERTGAARLATVAITETQPKLTTEKARALGITQQLSTYTTRYPYAAYRLQNIHRAARLIDGTVLLPGDTFSLNRTVGERTAANGFAVGIIINNGRFEKDFGGGVSQVATTTWNAAFFAGLQHVEHRPHSFFISRYPAGREATVAWGSIDLRFRNDDPQHGVLITTSYTDSTVTVTMWGAKRYDVASVSSGRYNVVPPGQVQYNASPDCVRQDPVSGFDIDVTRLFRRDGAVVRRETFHTHYDAAQPIVCGSPPAPKPASPAPTPGSTAKPTVPPATRPTTRPAPRPTARTTARPAATATRRP